MNATDQLCIEFVGGVLGLILLAFVWIWIRMDRHICRKRDKSRLVDKEQACLLAQYADVQTRRRSESLLCTLEANGRDA
jgi:hypothetical protein